MIVDTIPTKIPNNIFFSRKHRLSIAGTTQRNGIKSPAYVRVYEKISGNLIANSISDKFGNYSFFNLFPGCYVVVAIDPASQFNAVIQDNVVPK